MPGGFALGDVRADGVNVDRVDRLAGGDHQPVPLGSAEHQVRGGFRQHDVPHPLAFWREGVDAIEAEADPAATRPDVAIDVGPHGVRADDGAVDLDLGEFPRIRHRRDRCTVLLQRREPASLELYLDQESSLHLDQIQVRRVAHLQDKLPVRVPVSPLHTGRATSI